MSDADAAQLSSAANAERADALQPVALPFSNLSPEETLGGYTLAGLSLLFGNPETVGLLRGMGAADESIGALEAFGGVQNSVTALTYKPTSGVLLQVQEGSTTTILGSYNNDMRFVIEELGNVNSADFGPRIGGFNVLNVQDDLFVSPQQFWTEYNQPWLSNAIDRGDTFLMATRPAFDVTDVKTGFGVLTRPNPVTGRVELSGFGREYLMMRRAGYVYQGGAMTK